MKFFALVAALPFALSYAPDVHQLESVPDALSVTLPTNESSAEVRYKLDGDWSDWTSLEVDNEQDPLLRESNLAMFPPLAEAVRVRMSDDVTIHPIDIDESPVRYNVAATTNTSTPRILSRNDWGADESLLYREPNSSEGVSDNETIETGDNGGATSERIRECEAAQLNYPNEFKTIGRMNRDETGQTLRWTHEYSQSMKLIAIHHTAVAVGGDKRSGAERVRAIYAYHANNRGWGDVGYHYLIDEDGQVYEGKAGGKYIVAGHAYCNNINTLGVALLGNFEEEKPTQKQLKALQWLLKDLGEEYDIDLNKSVKYHGKTLEPVVGHRDLISTACPGFYIYGAIPQMLANAASGEVDVAVKLPVRITATSKKSTRSVSTRSVASSGIPRRVQRLLGTQASKLLRRKLGTNPGKEVETGVADRLAARQKSSSSVRSRKTPSISSASSRRNSRASSLSAVASKAKGDESSASSESSRKNIRIRLTRQETGAATCDAYDMTILRSKYRGTVTCSVIDNKAAIINTLSLEDYMLGLAEEPDTEPYEKQRAFAIAARTYALYYMDPTHLRKFPGMPYDGSDSPATFQLYGGKEFEGNNPNWVKAVKSTSNQVLMKDGNVIRAPYFSADAGRTRTPEEAGWNNFPFAEIFTAKDDPWCAGETLRGHGVGMSGCGAEGQANEGTSGEDILEYYYPGTMIRRY